MRFYRTPPILSVLYKGLKWRVPTTDKEIFLTFDDGPVPGPTEFVIDTLEKYKAAATFFCIGDNVGKHPEIFHKVVAKGHTIGNHTFNHLKGWNVDVEEYVGNVALCSNVMIEKGYNGKVNYFRPPYGRIKRSQIKALSSYEIVMWDVLTYDYDRTLSSDHCLEGTLRAIRPGSIVVMHDSTKAEKNMTYVLPRLLDHFSSLGYTFRSL